MKILYCINHPKPLAPVILRILLISSFFAVNLYSQTKWSRCKIDKTKLYECLDGEVKKKEFNKWYVAYECKNKDTKHYYWVADKIISDDVATPLHLGLSLLGTILGTLSANYSGVLEDSSVEIIPLIEERKRYLDSLERIKPNRLLACASLCGFATLWYLLIVYTYY